MPAAARLNDMSAGHCFFPRGNCQGSPNVFINGIPVHRVGDSWPIHKCKKKKHGSVQSQGSANVFVNGVAIARIGDSLSCGDVVAQGSPNVFVN